jgi:hypothetical protein
MSGVFRDVTIPWRGVDYTFTPSNRLLRSIESSGVNIVKVMTELSLGTVSVSALAYVAAAFLRAGGAAVTEDDLYGALMLGDENDIRTISEGVALALTPQGVAEKKAEAPGPAKPRAKAKRAPKK